MGTVGQNWQQHCQEIQNACSNSNWNQVIQRCNELIQYAKQLPGVTAVATEQNNAQQQQLFIQAHAQQD